MPKTAPAARKSTTPRTYARKTISVAKRPASPPSDGDHDYPCPSQTSVSSDSKTSAENTMKNITVSAKSFPSIKPSSAMADKSLESCKTKKIIPASSFPRTPPSLLPSPETAIDTAIASDLDQNLKLKIVVAMLESCKNFDWYQLSEDLKTDNTNAPLEKAKGRVKGGKKDMHVRPEAKGLINMNGNELRDFYYKTILPELKAGEALDCVLPPLDSTTKVPITPTSTETRTSASVVRQEMITPYTPAPARAGIKKFEAIGEVAMEVVTARSEQEEGTVKTVSQPGLRRTSRTVAREKKQYVDEGEKDVFEE